MPAVPVPAPDEFALDAWLEVPIACDVDVVRGGFEAELAPLLQPSQMIANDAIEPKTRARMTTGLPRPTVRRARSAHSHRSAN
jgi:hypothetical protein